MYLFISFITATTYKNRSAFQIEIKIQRDTQYSSKVLDNACTCINFFIWGELNPCIAKFFGL